MRYILFVPLLVSGAWAQKPTYHRDIAPIMAQHCVSCHKPGQMGPFPLTSYEEVQRAGPAIHQSIRGQRMPPDEKTPQHNPDFFQRTLREKELSKVTEWIELGMPEGEKPKR